MTLQHKESGIKMEVMSSSVSLKCVTPLHLTSHFKSFLTDIFNNMCLTLLLTRLIAYAFRTSTSLGADQVSEDALGGGVRSSRPHQVQGTDATLR